MLITQFGGDEMDSGSCLAFAPKHRSGALSGHSNVTQRDWQVPSVDSEDFVKLEPWAVPCDNQWAKDNPNKWEGSWDENMGLSGMVMCLHGDPA